MTFQKIRIVTDSVCDISPELLAQWKIVVIPCYVSYHNQSFADDGVQLDRQAFYRALPTINPYPTTAAPSPDFAADFLRRALEGYDHVIGVHVPAALSSTFANIRAAAAQIDASRFTLIDSQTLTMGLGMQVLIAAEVATATGSVQAVVETLEKVRKHQKLYAALYSLDALRRSGRVNSFISSVGALLQIKPIIEVRDSQVHPIKRIRTFSKAIDHLYELVAAQAPLDRLVVLHIQNLDGARAFLDRLGDIAPPDTPIVEVGPTLGTHIGIGSLGATTLSRNWKV
ncbi:DegV family protein [Aggregatilineales bacterium SYSU G02658]